MKFQNLKKKFKNNIILNVDKLVINANEKIGIVGKNGSGKTTLGEILIGTKKASSGELDFSVPYKTLRKNAVFQEASFDGELNLYTIASFYAQLFSADKDLQSEFTLFGLKDKMKRKYSSLSGGEKQKFKLMICFINNPNFILLDELTTSLDYASKQNIIHTLQKYFDQNQNVTSIIISHDPKELQLLCQRILVLKEGCIISDFHINEKDDLITIVPEVFSNESHF